VRARRERPRRRRATERSEFEPSKANAHLNPSLRSPSLPRSIGLARGQGTLSGSCDPDSTDLGQHVAGRGIGGQPEPSKFYGADLSGEVQPAA